MATINLKDLELLGCDYKRNVDIYLDPETGKIYKRTMKLIAVPAKTASRRQYNRIDLAESTVVELIDGKKFQDAQPVLERDN